MSSCLLIIPCFRESQRLPHFLPELLPEMLSLGGVEVLVVDDGSGDAEARATEVLVESLRAAYPCLRPLLKLPQNLGKGAAVYAGWDLADAAHDWLAFVDADGSCSATETARLIRLARQPHIDTLHPRALFASRIKMLGRKVERQWKRHLLGRVYATLVSETLKIPVYDSQCGLKLLPRSVYLKIRGQLQVPGFAFDVDLLVQLLQAGVKVEEVPIDWHEEPGGKVHLIRDSIRMARDVWHIRDRMNRIGTMGQDERD